MSPILALAALAAPALAPQQAVTPPEKFFGHEIGADYVLPNYQRLKAYWELLDRESDRMVLRTMGKTEEGRDQLMAIVSSGTNIRRLDHYKGIAQRLARAEGLTEEQAKQLSKEGKAVVWIDGGLHATEVLGAQQLMETLYRMISRNDEETRRILDEVIILFVHANPDGMDLVSDWYMRNPEPTRRSTANLPRLYQKYVGHDNNRDFYASTQKESENMNRVMYREWFPQIMYNHHQTGPRGTVMFAPPFRPPFNHHVDPLVMSGVELVGSAMHNRFIQEGKPGTTMRYGAGYSAWWNGGLRTTAYFHNIIGILTETIGSPNPMEIPFVPERQIMNGDLLFPIPPQTWKFRQSVEYSVTANLSILDLAARRRAHFLYGIYRMGKNSIDKGRADTWTNYPSRVATVMAQVGRDVDRAQTLLRVPELRDAKAYVIPSDQPDFPTAVKFVNALIETGVQVHRASAPFRVTGMVTGPSEHPSLVVRRSSTSSREYPAGSLVIRCDQAFRPHILDMFEPQDHPNDIPAPGAPPTPPYDSAGWTLAYQMGVEFDRVLEPLNVPLQEVPDVIAQVPGGVSGQLDYQGYVFSPVQNDSFTLLSGLLQRGVRVYRVTALPTDPEGRNNFIPGAFWAPRSPTADALLDTAIRTGGLRVTRTGSPLGAQPVAEIAAPRVALWDVYGGSMPSGWIRWLLEQFKIPFTGVFAPEIGAGNLNAKYDVLILPTGAIPGLNAQDRDQPFPASIPREFEKMWGRVGPGEIAQIKAFLENGGRVVAIGSSTNLAYHLGLPVESVVAGLARAKYYIPGSLLQARVDNTLPIAWGMKERADFFFDESPVFRFKEGAEAAGLKRIAWFETDKPLRSGWAWGQEVLKDGVAAFQARVGNGMLYAFGPEITFRAQPHGTFKFLFNGIFQ